MDLCRIIDLILNATFLSEFPPSLCFSFFDLLCFHFYYFLFVEFHRGFLCVRGSWILAILPIPKV